MLDFSFPAHMMLDGNVIRWVNENHRCTPRAHDLLVAGMFQCVTAKNLVLSERPDVSWTTNLRLPF